MSIVDCVAPSVNGEVSIPATPRPLHRLAMVRRLQGISRGTLARRMNVSVTEIRRQEEETNDLPLSLLYKWQKILDVPIAELLVDSEDSLSQPLLQRAQLVRLMKTALSLLEQAESEATARWRRHSSINSLKSCRNCKESAPGKPLASDAAWMRLA